MKERPILFSGPMVKAILAGKKTQTRRVVKPQPKPGPFPDGIGGPDSLWWEIRRGKRSGWFGCTADQTLDMMRKHCPYGVPGDRLWVREAFDAGESGGGVNDLDPAEPGLWYRADHDFGSYPWKPSIHMPRWASRLTLEVVSVRVERLQEISEEDARAEGFDHVEGFGYLVQQDPKDKGVHQGWGYCDQASEAFVYLWENINGKGSWDQNPWVWVVEFKVVGGGQGQ